MQCNNRSISSFKHDQARNLTGDLANLEQVLYIQLANNTVLIS